MVSRRGLIQIGPVVTVGAYLHMEATAMIAERNGRCRDPIAHFNRLPPRNDLSMGRDIHW